MSAIKMNAGKMNMRKMRAAMTCGLVALAIAGCSSKPKDPENTNWLMRGGDFAQTQHADLTTINKDNVGELGLAWAVEMPSPSGLVGNPLVKDGVVYQSGSLARVFANDIHTGKLLWQYEPKFDFANLGPIPLWSARLNRGVALDGNSVFVAAGDCRIISIDQKTGKENWQAQSCEGPWMGITGAPQVGDGKVFTGNNCGDSGLARGFIDAFDQKTGKRAWRFWTVPGDPSKPAENKAMEMAAKTWGTDWYSKSHGCGSAWDSMTYDKETNLIYVGIGGPGPWGRDLRAKDAGDELFTNAVVAINASTGEYVWHFTVTPHDGWNFEAVGPITIANLPVDGKDRRVVMLAPKNGFFYVLDAKTGKFISGKAAMPMNWAKGLDKNGRPIMTGEGEYWKKPEGAVVWPEPMGAHSWANIAYDPKQKLVYVPYDNVPARAYQAGHEVADDVDNIKPDYPGQKIPPKYSELVAWDPVKQEARWRWRTNALVNGGVLHTAGGLVFQGTSDGHFNAFDDATGKKLWSYDTEGGVRSAPTSVMVDGEQYILIASGNGNSMVAGRYVSNHATTPVTDSAPAMLLAFKIGGKATLPKVAAVPLPKPDFPKPDPALAAHGKVAFAAAACLICHGRDAHSPGGDVPDLRRLDSAKYALFNDIVRGGLLKDNGMPEFKGVPDEFLDSVKAYIQSASWEAYERQEAAKKK